MIKKVYKGNAGYYHYERIKRCLVTLLMFAIPIGIFITGVIVNGTRKNLLTIVAILGILPAARFAVSWIMVMLAKDARPEIVSATEQTAGELVRAYELTVTAYEGRMPLDALVICGNQVVCCAPEGKKDKLSFMEKHIEKILTSNGYRQVHVKIFSDLRSYSERISQISQNPGKYREGISFTPDERYPDLSREQMILHTIMAISI